MVVKVIAAYQVVAGVVLAVVILSALAHGTTLAWQYELVAESIIAAAVVGGVALWRGEPPGFLLSCVVQLLQIVQLFTRQATFALLLGPNIGATYPFNAAPFVRLELRAALMVFVAAAAPDVQPGVVINFAAVIVLFVLIHQQQRSGQPWLRPRGTRAPWDRARLIGAYQIGAGSLGVFNSMFATAQGVANLLLSLVIIASGVALVRRARWSDAIGVAVNAVQVPAFAIGSVVFLVRSGFSLVVALASGAGGGLRFQFDVGSMLGETLAPNIDSFVGINVTALALALILATDDADKAATAPKFGFQRALDDRRGL